MLGRNRLWKIVVLLLLVVALATSATAYVDFIGWTEFAEIEACSCMTNVNKVFVENTGNQQATFFFSNVDTPTWITTVPTKATLKPGETAVVQNFIRAPCGDEGEYNLATMIDDRSVQKMVAQKLFINRCQNLEIEFDGGMEQEEYETLSVCPCTPKDFDFKLTNTGTFIESYILNITPYAEGNSVSKSEITIPPGETKTITATINLDCSVNGLEDFELLVTAGTNQYEYNVPMTMNITGCYDFSFTAPKKVNACLDEDDSIAIKLVNAESFDNSYNLTLDSPDWAVLQKEHLDIPAKVGKSTKIDLKPLGIATGKYTLSLKAISDMGLVEKEKKITVEVKKCFGIDVVLSGTRTCDCDEGVLVADIFNKGKDQSEFEVKVRAPLWMEMDTEKTLTIKAEETGSIGIPYGPFCGSAGTYPVTVEIEDINNPDNTFYAEKELQLLHPRQCKEAVVLIGDNQKITTGQNKIPIEIKNIGEKSAAYEMSIDAPDWAWLDDYYIELEPREKRIINLMTAAGNADPKGDYEINLEAKLSGDVYSYSSKHTVTLVSKSSLFIVDFIILYWPPFLFAFILTGICSGVYKGYRHLDAKTRRKILRRMHKFTRRMKKSYFDLIARFERNKHKVEKKVITKVSEPSDPLPERFLRDMHRKKLMILFSMVGMFFVGTSIIYIAFRLQTEFLSIILFLYLAFVVLTAVGFTALLIVFEKKTHRHILPVIQSIPLEEIDEPHKDEKK